MKILVVHNKYIYRGGEDTVVENEVTLLREEGHDIMVFSKSNAELSDYCLVRKIFYLCINIFFNFNVAKEFKQVVEKFHPDIIHVHNISYIISPSIFWVAKSYAIPSVQTLHNFRISCLNGLFYCKDKICERCIKGNFIPGIVNKCFKGSLFASISLSAVLFFWRSVGVWSRWVNGFIALTEFSRNKYIEMGLPKDNIYIKPNCFASDYQCNKGATRRSEYALFVGRISDEKGIRFLVENWPETSIDLTIAGEGPILCELKNYVAGNNMSNIEFLGQVNRERCMNLMAGAAFLVFGSLWYENFPMVLLEAFANSLAVLAPRHGNIEYIVEDNYNGLLYNLNDNKDFQEKLHNLCSDKRLQDILGSNSRNIYDKKYLAKENYKSLIAIYEKVINHSKQNER